MTFHATVLRNDVDCTNGGLSSKTRRVIIIGEFDEVPNDPILPLLRLKTRGDYRYLEPVKPVPKGHAGWMAGGNFAYSSDSRFSEEVNEYPVAIHDRSDTWEDFEILSR